jgi:hypothetical protein
LIAEASPRWSKEARFEVAGDGGVSALHGCGIGRASERGGGAIVAVCSRDGRQASDRLV